MRLQSRLAAQAETGAHAKKYFSIRKVNIKLQTFLTEMREIEDNPNIRL